MIICPVPGFVDALTEYNSAFLLKADSDFTLLQETVKEARNSFVGRAQTGFQFSRETQKLKQTNKNGVALSFGFNILRRSFKSCV